MSSHVDNDTHDALMRDDVTVHTGGTAEDTLSQRVSCIIEEMEKRMGVREIGDINVTDGACMSPDYSMEVVRRLFPVQMQATSMNNANRDNDPSVDLTNYAHPVDIQGSVDSEWRHAGDASAPTQVVQLKPVHEDLFPLRRQRLRELFDMFNEIQDVRDSVGDKNPLSEEFDSRLSRLVEIVWVAENVAHGQRMLSYLLCKGSEHLRNINTNHGYLGCFGELFGRIVDKKKVKGQDDKKLLLLLLSRLRKSRLRRYSDNVMYAIVINGTYTYAWKRARTIEQWVWDNVNKDMDSQIFEHAVANKGNISWVIEYLKKCDDCQFPQLIKERRLHAFRNALYVTAVRDATTGRYRNRSHVYYFSSTEDEIIKTMVAGGKVAACYHDCDFPVPDEDGVIRPRTPNMDVLMDHQEWPEEVKEWARALLGRMLHPISSGPSLEALDNWQVTTMLIGIGGTGKSTFIDHVVGNFFEAEDIAIIGNNMEKQFGWSACYGKFMWLAPEVKEDFAEHTDQAMWQTVVEGAKMTAAKKYSSPVCFEPFDLPGIMAGNENIGFHDNGDSVARRRIDFQFGKMVRDSDPLLPHKLAMELGHIMYRCNESYLQKTREVKTRIWQHLPQYFQNTQRENAAQTNALENFLQNGNLTFNRDCYTSYSDFNNAFINFCNAERILGRRTLRKDYYQGPFARRHITATQQEERIDKITGQKRKSVWFDGVCLEN